MTREETILKLLAVAPAARSDLVLDTGWGIEETNSVVDGLMRAGKVVPFPMNGNNARRACRLCLPALRDRLLQALGGRHAG